MNSKNRKTWLDFLRGIAMLLVIIGHFTENCNIYFQLTSPVKIPLFFAITGYLFSDMNGDIKAFCKKMFFRLFIPWLVLSIPPYIAIGLYKGSFGYIGNKLIEIVTGKLVWYMPCCIIAETAFFLTHKYVRPVIARSAVSIMLCIVGIVLTNHKILGIFMINRALTVQFFLLIGYLIKIYEKYLRKAWLFIVCIAVYAVLGFIAVRFYPNGSINVHSGRYYSYPICFSMIITGVITLFIAAPTLIHRPLAVSFIGRNTLVYYIWSYYFGTALERGLKLIGITVRSAPLLTISKTVFACLCCGICAYLLNRFLPLAVGKRKKA